MSHTITIYDIAKQANVSASTVSRALSKPGRLSATTEYRIRGIAERMGYLLDASETRPQRPDTGIIAAILPDYLNSYHARILHSVERHITAKPYNCSLITVGSSIGGNTERRTIANLLKIADGLILISSTLSEPDIRRIALVRPLVTIDRIAVGLSSVAADSNHAIDEAMHQLRSSGHRSVAYLVGSFISWAGERRRSSVRMAAYRYHMRYLEFKAFTPNVEGGAEAAGHYLKSPTDAVFAFNDQIALGFMHAIGKAGMRVPEDVSVIGFDNDPQAAVASPGLNTIDLHPDQMGALAAQVMIAQIGSAQTRPVARVEASSYIQRDSVSRSKRSIMRLGPYVDFTRQGGKVTVLTMLSSSFNETMPRIDAFMRAHPDIVIDPIDGQTKNNTMALYWEQLKSRQSVPDLLNVEYDAMPQFAASGALLNLSTRKVEQSWGDEFNPAAWESAHFAGGLYGIPGDQSQTVMFYRRDLMRRYGLRAPRTWEEFYEEGVRLHQRNPNRFMGVIDTTDVQHYLSFLRMAGARPWRVLDTASMEFDLHSPLIRTTAAFIQRCLDDGVLHAEPLWDGRYALPKDDRYATIVYANWFGKILASSYPSTRGLWAVALPPAFDDPSSVKTAEIGGSMLAISTKAPRRHQRLAMQFAHWFQANPISVDLRATGGYSATTYFQENPEVLAIKDSFFDQHVYSDTMVPQLVAGGHSDRVLASWQDNLVSYARSQGFSVK